MNKSFWLVLLALIPLTLLARDYEQAMNAYDRQDYRQAFNHFAQMANQGDPYAQYMLGRQYRSGNGVLQNYVEAHKWFNLASVAGHRHAAASRDEVAKNMTRQQIAQAQQLASEWRPSGGQQITQPQPQPQPAPQPPALSRKDIREIQTALNQLGFDAGKPDGNMGRRTRLAIRAYQEQQKMHVTGQPSKALLAHLRSTLANRQPEKPNWPWSETLLVDNFKDGDFTYNPRWTVAAGDFWVDRNWGLRTVHDLPYGFRSQKEKRKEDKKHIGLVILQSILEQNNNSSQQQQPQPDYAELFIQRPVTNAFALKMRLYSERSDGHLEFGPFQRKNRALGYRLVYKSGESGGLYLVHLSSKGSTVLAQARARVRLEDRKPHDLMWVRGTRGEMLVYIDGQEMLRVTDRSFANDFRGFTLVNQGGSYGFRNISLEGTP